VPLEHPAAGPGAIQSGMTAAAGTTHPKGGTFGGITARMGLITTLTEESHKVQDVESTRWNVPAGVLEPSGALVPLMVIEETEGQEAVLIESPTGIAYGTSGVVLFFFPCWS